MHVHVRPLREFHSPCMYLFMGFTWCQRQGRGIKFYAARKLTHECGSLVAPAKVQLDEISLCKDTIGLIQ